MSYLQYISEEKGKSSKGIWTPTIICKCGNMLDGDEPSVSVDECEQCEGNMIELYETDYLLKNANNEYVKDINGNYVIYSEGARDEEIIHEGDEWIKTTELPSDIEKEVIKQLEKKYDRTRRR